MKRIYFKDDIVPIIIVRDQATTFPIAQVLSKTVKGRRTIWEFRKAIEAKRMAIRIAFDTLDQEDIESFKLALFVVRKPRSLRYGLEVVVGRRLCVLCQCDMAYEKYGFPVCKYHRRNGESDPPCPVCDTTPKKSCGACGGSGVGPLDDGAKCSVCNGSGIKTRRQR